MVYTNATWNLSHSKTASYNTRTSTHSVGLLLAFRWWRERDVTLIKIYLRNDTFCYELFKQYTSDTKEKSVR